MNLGSVIAESELLKINTATYGWSIAEQSRYVEGVASSIESLSDSRVNNMLNLAQKYGLRIRGSEGGIVLDAGCGPGAVAIPARRKGINIIARRSIRSPRLRFRHFLAQIDARLFGSFGRKTWKVLKDRSCFPQ